MELARGTGFIRLICNLADNLSTSCRYADFRPSLKNKTVNEFCEPLISPSPPQKSVCSLETKVPVQEVVNTCSLINCCLTCNFNVLANSPPMQCIVNIQIRNHYLKIFWMPVYTFLTNSRQGCSFLVIHNTYLAQIHE